MGRMIQAAEVCLGGTAVGSYITQPTSKRSILLPKEMN